MSIEVRNLVKQFTPGLAAVRGVTFRVEAGEMVGLLGPSGSGKTTLLRMIAGLEAPTSGVIFIGGRDVTRTPPQRRGVGVVFQHYALFQHMTVFDNIAFGLKVKRWPKSRVRERVAELLALVRLTGFEHRHPAELSGGQAQRVALARALAPEPGVLLLDEPFAAVDTKIRKELREWVRRVHEEVGITSIFVTHDQEEAFELADRVMVFHDGQIEQFGPPQQLWQAPATSFVASFVGDVNEVEAEAAGGFAKLGTLRLPLRHPARDGQRVKVLIRTTDISVSPHPQGAAGQAPPVSGAPDVPDVVDARVRRRVWKGAADVLYVELAGGVVLRAVVPREVALQVSPGAPVSLRILDYRTDPL
ncbi:MAG: sulfate ABC transporter ATP-binding protein [Alicyclobacillaceae bacterium]|nr:sulfate ABC transporter ATP-binding protein [Alicyclobacillaceae bacterium]